MWKVSLKSEKMMHFLAFDKEMLSVSWKCTEIENECAYETLM